MTSIWGTFRLSVRPPLWNSSRQLIVYLIRPGITWCQLNQQVLYIVFLLIYMCLWGKSVPPRPMMGPLTQEMSILCLCKMRVPKYFVIIIIDNEYVLHLSRSIPRDGYECYEVISSAAMLPPIYNTFILWSQYYNLPMTKQLISSRWRAHVPKTDFAIVVAMEFIEYHSNHFKRDLTFPTQPSRRML